MICDDLCSIYGTDSKVATCKTSCLANYDSDGYCGNIFPLKNEDVTCECHKFCLSTLPANDISAAERALCFDACNVANVPFDSKPVFGAKNMCDDYIYNATMIDQMKSQVCRYVARARLPMTNVCDSITAGDSGCLCTDLCTASCQFEEARPSRQTVAACETACTDKCADTCSSDAAVTADTIKTLINHKTAPEACADGSKECQCSARHALCEKTVCSGLTGSVAKACVESCLEFADLECGVPSCKCNTDCETFCNGDLRCLAFCPETCADAPEHPRWNLCSRDADVAVIRPFVCGGMQASQGITPANCTLDSVTVSPDLDPKCLCESTCTNFCYSPDRPGWNHQNCLDNCDTQFCNSTCTAGPAMLNAVVTHLGYVRLNHHFILC